jgi:hypothetical protein
MKDIVNYIHKNSWFQLDGDLEDFDDGDELLFATRDNGNVGDETFGQKDWDEGQRLLVDLMREFGEKINGFNLDTCDEWVNLEVVLKCWRCKGEMRIDDYEHGDLYSEDGKMPCPTCEGNG